MTIGSVKPVGATASSDGSGNQGTWQPLIAAGTPYKGNVQPVGLMMSSDGSGNPGTWVPATPTSFGGVNISGQVSLTNASMSNGLIVPNAGVNLLTISNIPQGFINLRIAFMGRTTDAALQASIYWRCNGDGGANYDFGYMDGGSAAPSGGGAAAQNAAFIGQIAGASALASYAGSIIIDIPFYSQSTFFKTALALTQWQQGTAGVINIGTMTACWRGTAAINSVTLYNNAAGTFVAGTVCSVFAS